MSASSSTTEGISDGRRRVKTPGIPSKRCCGESITELISKSNLNPYRRYYRCLYAAQVKDVVLFSLELFSVSL
ncbi:hypothetical protein F2Q69_00021630 [Brassica cretica]|uniref:Uncharacterized protein n=1 Tax=Brassica cretica TaxID=69181 RepID=A0A8S9PWT9_BRACR|nr:hypothetical protein F2Q69_00021630 [Brassica cretica]